MDGELAQVVIDQRQQLLRGLRLAVLDGVKNARHLTITFGAPCSKRVNMMRTPRV
jgi:hypothetical protein